MSLFGWIKAKFKENKEYHENKEAEEEAEVEKEKEDYQKKIDNQFIKDFNEIGAGQTLQESKNESKSKSPLLIYPDAVLKNMPTAGKHRNGYPEGVIVHYTSGWDRHYQDALNTNSWGSSQGFLFDVASPDGRIIQGATLDKWGHHAGVSKWPTLGGDVSKYLRGIEVACAGLVDSKGKSWFGAQYNPEQLRVIKESNHYGQAGTYKKVTEEQFISVTNYIVWLYKNSPFVNGKRVFSIDHVLAHHEVAGKMSLGYWRKTDIGGSWPMPMDEYRDYIKKQLGI